MNYLQKSYKKTVNAIGCTLLLWLVMFYLLNIVGGFLDVFFELIPNKVLSDVLGSFVYDAIYLSSFMLPALLFKSLMKHDSTEPIGFDFKIPPYTIPFIFAGITCSFTFSFVNSVLAQAISNPEATENPMFMMPSFTSDYSIVLQFISIALVPAFCEEFLFRGVILSNLKLYGKGNAIILSSLLFATMHGNAYQFIYTFVAGIIMGYLYVKTQSIWPSTLMHMLNNSISLLQSVILERFEEKSALVWMAFLELLLFFVGIVCLVFLVIKYGKNKIKSNNESEKCYQKDLQSNEANMGASQALTTKDAFRLFLRPTILAFILFSFISGMMPIIITWMNVKL